ncbi:hypothetical protein ANCDUO_05645 [Ancylostoma duodenale]|uniref:Uncharacterized protein n=1 Tax=Ancylostoma duodenale TaxID=51022 RepID=A0A0C2H3N7_9BILA|nr:hypothetical protein ANCDUO_05645 [Ancylostoma duodenale]
MLQVKCTSNARIEIDDCADILLPGNEVQLLERESDFRRNEMKVPRTNDQGRGFDFLEVACMTLFSESKRIVFTVNLVAVQLSRL